VSEPERQCIGCGCRGPQAEFVRLTCDRETTPARVVVTKGKTLVGRSAYLCKRRACLDRALHRKAFQRAFRTSVVVDEKEIAAALSERTATPDDETGD